MFLSDELIATCQQRMEPFDCEGFLYGRGSLNPRIMFVGEAPGETEIHNGIPFSGRAGKEFDRYLTYLNLDRNDVYITSAVRSRPFKWKRSSQNILRKYNRTPNQKEIAAHAPILDAEIKHTAPPVIAPMGRIAYWRLLGTSPRMQEVTGIPITSPIRYLADWENNMYQFSEKAFTIIPIYHPAAILYNRRLEPSVFAHLDVIKQYIEGK
ncbi:DNA polymerase [Alteribacillus persepolensis]|uniref:DNA polymerase n=1 Tax=Alteribacillus persepolensis TaxID=568899 RepID=A0A1G8GEW7_9BACI|nr:uracil-DNA glycosylase [Alteribacillus persepolensis]SDH92870.1 DNA polymerase [Alteribacillus persepolensis]